MDSLVSLWPIFVAGAIIIGITWYVIGRKPPNQKRARTKPTRQKKQSADEIAATTKQDLAKARTVEEAFAIGREKLNQISRQIKESKHDEKRRKKY